MKGQIRIIGGVWRGRKLEVPAIADLRPTPDRVRETLFNWLSLILPGARCLDAFAGSGALGFEALSRGAKSVVFIDKSAAIVKLLQTQLLKFKAESAEVICADFPHVLNKTLPDRFDVIFLDPPYKENILLRSCFFLEENNFLASTAYIYLESATGVEEKDLPPNWQLIKDKKAGQVVYQLAKRTINNEKSK